MGTLLKNAKIVNEGIIFSGHILIENEIIAKIFKINDDITSFEKTIEIIDVKGNYLLPGLIDDQVHFREPGLTHKATIKSESRAAVAGGITSFMEMPNTVPNTLTQELLQDKYDIAEKTSFSNYSFYMGASNDNIEEVLKTNPKTVCGVKVFMGSSTGNMLVDNAETLEELFSKCKLLIAAHCEDETTIRNNMATYKEKYGEDIPVECHPEIRSEEACYKSSAFAIQLAKKHNTRFHLFHLSTAKEIELLENKTPLKKNELQPKHVFIIYGLVMRIIKPKATLSNGILQLKKLQTEMPFYKELSTIKLISLLPTMLRIRWKKNNKVILKLPLVVH